jgi:hypothetical protein
MVLQRVGIGAAAGRNRAGQRRIHRVAVVDAECEQYLAFAPRAPIGRLLKSRPSAVGQDQEATSRQ